MRGRVRLNGSLRTLNGRAGLGGGRTRRHFRLPRCGRHTHGKLREKTRSRRYQPSSASSHEAFGSRQSSMSGTGRGKGKQDFKGGSVHQKKLVTRCFDCNRFGYWSGDPICTAKHKHDAQRRCTFTLSRLSRAQFQLNKSSEGQEHATLAAIAPLLVRSG